MNTHKENKIALSSSRTEDDPQLKKLHCHIYIYKSLLITIMK